MTTPQIFSFDGWTLRVDLGELSKEGRKTRLQDQPLLILVELLMHAGQMVTREQLIARLWPKGVVDFDAGLNSAVRKLRVALDDVADTPRYIETIPRKGYRFVGQLDGVPLQARRSTDIAASASDVPIGASGTKSVEPIAPTKRRVHRAAWVAAAASFIALVGVLSYKSIETEEPNAGAAIVVLPFVDMSTDQRDEALCDGLTEEISNWLAQVPSLRVVARSSAFVFKGKSADAREVGKVLAVSHVLEGSIRRAGDVVRVTTQLIDARDGFHLWSRTFDLTSTNPLMVEDQISQAVTDALQIELAPEIAKQLADRQSTDVKAFERYLIGRYYFRKVTTADNAHAIRLFQQAIAIDQRFALAYVSLAQGIIRRAYFEKIDPVAVAPEAESLLARAEQLNATLPEIYSVRGGLLADQYRFLEALATLEKAIAINASDAGSYKISASILRDMGKSRDSLAKMRTALQLDPMDFLQYVHLCLLLQTMASFPEADVACTRARTLEPENLWGPLATASLARSQGRLDEALEWSTRAISIAPNDPMVVADRSMLLVSLGLLDQAEISIDALDRNSVARLELLARLNLRRSGPTGMRRAAVLADESKFESFSDLTKLAEIFYYAGDTESARRAIDKARSAPDFSNERLFDPANVHGGTIPALTWACVEFADRKVAAGNELLRELDIRLEQLERDGLNGHGIEALRSEIAALRHRDAEALKHLEIAIEKGWFLDWYNESAPHFSHLKSNPKFVAMMSKIKARNAAMTLRAKGSL